MSEDDQDALVEDAPDPLEVVRVLKSDFDMLQLAADMALEHYKRWLLILGIEPGDAPPALVMEQAVFPAVEQLLITAKHVKNAETDLRARAARFGNQTKDFGGGVSGVKVGQRIPGGLPGLVTMTRRERREFERQERDRRG